MRRNPCNYWLKMRVQVFQILTLQLWRELLHYKVRGSIKNDAAMCANFIQPCLGA